MHMICLEEMFYLLVMNTHTHLVAAYGEAQCPQPPTGSWRVCGELVVATAATATHTLASWQLNLALVQQPGGQNTPQGPMC